MRNYLFDFISRYITIFAMGKTSGNSKNKSKGKSREIVIEESKDILEESFGNDSEDLKKEVDRESQKNFLFDILVPIITFAVIGALLGYGAWRLSDNNNNQSNGTVEEKVVTPPNTEEDESQKDKTQEEKSKEEPKEQDTEKDTEKEYIVYTVKSGDTLSDIANAYDMTSKELADYNGISDPNSLQIGQKIKIPTK